MTWLGGLCRNYRDQYEREIKPRTEADDLMDELNATLVSELLVKGGPFAGMKYPSTQAVCSAFTPKLLGTYEYELHEIIEDILQRGYTQVLDVGCAEGYYAVGLALRMPQAHVYAYDTDPEARKLCLQMGEANGVADRLLINSYCSPESLSTFNFTGRGLVVCDCEGFEKELFTPEALANLSECDLLIEMHDLIDITISTHLAELFKNSHRQTLIRSIDDIQKAKTYSSPLVRGDNLSFRKTVFAEGREDIMEWLFLEAKAGV